MQSCFKEITSTIGLRRMMVLMSRANFKEDIFVGIRVYEGNSDKMMFEKKIS